MKPVSCRALTWCYCMFVAARMESSGWENRIHISMATANLLKKAGKHRWIEQRPEKITIKGKGELQTFWIRSKRTKNSGPHLHTSDDSTKGKANMVTETESICSQPVSDLWGSEDAESGLL